MLSVGLVASGNPALAVHQLQMQLDGNTAVDGGNSRPLDWESLYGAGSGGDIAAKSTALPANFLARGAVADYALPEFSTFATGSKDTLDISGWQCGKSNNLGAKDDLVNVYTTAYRNPANNHLILYFGAEKSSNLGDNNIGIWFVQDANVGCTVPANGHNTTFSGLHQKGDVLLTAAFTNGGTQATVESHAWTANGTLGTADSGFLCAAPDATPTTAQQAADTSACAITNLSEFNPPWNHPLKTPGTNGALAPQEFYEGGVDVTQLEIDSGNGSSDPCITTFVADTRSSQSPTATLFDYALGSIPVCHPATTLSLSRNPATIHSGDSVTWTAVEQNTGTSPISNVAVHNAAAGACQSFTYVSGDTNSNAILDPGANNLGESWTFTCTQTNVTASTTMNVYGTGTDTISGKTIAGGPATSCTFDATGHVTFAAANTVCDPNERATASVTVIHPGTTLGHTAVGVSPSTGIVHVGDNVTYTFHELNDGDVALSNPSVTTDDANCPTATYLSGDTITNGVLDVSEEWAFTCTTSYTASGAGAIHAVGHGTDSLGADVTYYQVAGADCTAGVISSGKLCDLQERASANVTVINPGTVLRENVSAVVTFVYSENNAGDSVITSPSVSSDCAGAGAVASPVLGVDAVHNVGDAGNDGVFSPGETWKFSCSKTVTISANNTATFTDNATGHGTDAAGSSVPTTNETDSSTATITNNAPN